MVKHTFTQLIKNSCFYVKNLVKYNCKSLKMYINIGTNYLQHSEYLNLLAISNIIYLYLSSKLGGRNAIIHTSWTISHLQV